VLEFIEWVLRFVVDPLMIWVLLLGVLVFLYRRKNSSLRKIVLGAFVVFSLILSSPCALYLASQPLENFALKQFKYADASLRNEIPCSEYEGVIALGGVIPNADFNEVRGIQLTAGAERVTEPVRLQNLCPDFTLVYTSFGKELEDGVGESELARDLWIGLGVPKSKIIIENGSTNTRENAIETKKLLKGERKWLLVSSASHLKRAYSTFVSAGVKVDPIPVDYLFSEAPPIWSFAPLSTVSGWQGVFHEYVGGIYYSLKGWI
jgi:uncharacterized SAM-binding protein YcdF (DUF218 family)